MTIAIIYSLLTLHTLSNITKNPRYKIIVFISKAKKPETNKAEFLLLIHKAFRPSSSCFCGFHSRVRSPGDLLNPTRTIVAAVRWHVCMDRAIYVVMPRIVGAPLALTSGSRSCC